MTKSKHCKLSNETRSLIFEEFNKIQSLLKAKGFRYYRRFSEPRKSGFGYRCKWWICNIDAELLALIQNNIPEDWYVDFTRDNYGGRCIALYTPKFSN